MAEIAEDIIDGTACSLCGQYFEDPDNPTQTYTHGYPVVCSSCWNMLDEHTRKVYRKASAETF